MLLLACQRGCKGHTSHLSRGWVKHSTELMQLC
jgi:hypothetical protein